MDQQPKIPTLKDAQKPQVKIKGMGAGLTLFDRLKQFKKKDLAFILAGLGTLFMAPLAEHFMMAPENGDASLQQGWGKGGTSGSFFGSGSSPYESGSHMASGGAIGGSGDIITPLNVRDPSSLVMGPGGTQQPPAGSAAPSAPPPTAPSRSDEDYKDALKGAASRAASAAVKKAPLPVPKVALGGSGLRGLGVAAGGSSASSGGSLPVGPAAGSVGGGGNSGLRLVRNTPGFKGVAGSRSPTGGTGLDNTKKAGANAGDAFNRAGSAAAGLNAAANETIPTGGQGFGGGGHGGAGANDKPGSGTGPGGSKSVGESLAFLRAKQRQEEELKLEFEKRKLKDPELLLYGIRNDILKASAGKIGEGLTSLGMCKVLNMGCPGSDDPYRCDNGMTQTKSQLEAALCAGAGKPGEAAGVTTNCFEKGGADTYIHKPGGYKCSPTGESAAGAGAPKTEGEGVSSLNPTTAAPPSAAASSVNTLCTTLDGVIASFTTSGGGPRAAGGQESLEAYKDMREAAAHLLQARNSLTGGSADGACGGESPKLSVNGQHPVITNKLGEVTNGVTAGLNGLVPKLTAAGTAELTRLQGSLGVTKTLIADAKEQLERGEDNLDDVDVTFALPAADANNRGLKGLGDTLTAANTLKGELATAVTKGKERQAVLEKAQEDLEATAAAEANSSLVMGQNDEYDLMKKSQPGLAIPDADFVEEGATPAATPPKTYAEVTAAIEAAKEAILDACDRKKCVAAPAPAAGSPAPAVPDMTNNRAVMTANQKVKEMRDAQRGYLAAIQGKIIPAVPTTSATGDTTAAR